MSWDMYDMTQKVQVVVVAIVLPLVILAVSLWHDWVEEGQSPRARKIMKDWEWNIDEMAHAVNVKGRLIGYRVLQAGVIIYLGYSRRENRSRRHTRPAPAHPSHRTLRRSARLSALP